MYSGTQHTHLEYLKQFLANSEPLMLLIAEDNSSKASLITKLITDIQIKQRVIRLQGNENLQPTQLTQLLSQHCDINLDDINENYEYQLDKIVQSLTTQHLTCVFIIDDAERLPVETLTTLLHISMKQNTYHTHLHIILAGNIKLAEKVKTLQIKPSPQLLLNALPHKDLPTKHKHWVKGISVSLLLVIICVMWYHKEHHHLPFMQPKSLQDVTLKPVTMTSDIHFVSAEKEDKSMATIKPKAVPSVETKQKLATTRAHSTAAYTLQLMGSRNLNALEHFVAKNNLTKSAHIMTTVYQGNPWYIITYGEYQTTSQAKIARHQLPLHLQKLHPWVRPKSTIH